MNIKWVLCGLGVFIILLSLFYIGFRETVYINCYQDVNASTNSNTSALIINLTNNESEFINDSYLDNETIYINITNKINNKKTKKEIKYNINNPKKNRIVLNSYGPHHILIYYPGNLKYNSQKWENNITLNNTYISKLKINNLTYYNKTITYYKYNTTTNTTRYVTTYKPKTTYTKTTYRWVYV